MDYPINWNLAELGPEPGTDDFAGRCRALAAGLRDAVDRVTELPAPAGASAGAWAGFMRRLAELTTERGQLISLAGCHAAADSENDAFRRAEAELAALMPQVEAVAAAIEAAVRDVDDVTLDAFVAADAFLDEIAFVFRDARDLAALRLPSGEESVANELAVDGLHAWGRLYDRIAGELKAEVMTADGVLPKSIGQVRWTGPERTVREQNFYAADRAWAGVAQTCADCLNHISGSRLTRYRRLGFDHLEEPLRRNRIRRETLEALLGAVADRRDVLKPYLDQKAAAIGVERLAWFDQSCPLPVSGRPPESVTYDQACGRIGSAFARFDAGFAEFAEKSLSSSWVEAEDRGGKRPGGFCTDLPASKQTRIFMTFLDDDDSVSTLAHELGHAYHSWLLKDRPVFLRDYPMNLAETASTFAEQVLTDARLAEADAEQERQILDAALSDATAYLLNLPARFRFEDAFYRERASGELSTARLDELMLEAQREAYGDALASWHPRFWAAKLHFYITELPFYNFPYTFGYLLSLGAYADAAGSEDFPERYRAFLNASGSTGAEEAVRTTLGYDLTDRAFWSGAVDVVADRVTRFVALGD